jgi:hypothetical protein
MSKKDILCDIDGTLANPEHRLGLIATRPKNWKGFFDASINDPVYEDIAWLVRSLHNLGNNILIVTARPENNREITEKWLHTKAGLEGFYKKMYMREAGDYRDDSIVKEEILAQIRADGYNPYMVLDDRDRVCAMWRKLGIRCLQVKPGDF